MILCNIVILLAGVYAEPNLVLNLLDTSPWLMVKNSLFLFCPSAKLFFTVGLKQDIDSGQEKW